jgi:hypothetical protein
VSDKIQEAKQHAYSGNGGELIGATELLEVIVDGFGWDLVESVVFERILETVTEDVSEERVDELELSAFDRVEVAVLDSDMVVGDVACAEVVIDWLSVVNEVGVDVDDVKVVVGREVVSAGAVEVVGRGVTEVISGGEVAPASEVVGVVTEGGTELVAWGTTTVGVPDLKVVVGVDDVKVVVGREVVSAGAVEVVGRGVTEVISGGEVAPASEVVTGVVTKGRTEVVVWGTTTVGAPEMLPVVEAGT